MVMPPRRSSSGMQSIRRELQRRRPKPLAPKNSAAKKSSLPPPPPREGARSRPLPPRLEISSSTASKSPPCSAATDAPRPHPSPRPTSISPSTPPPPSRSAPSACPSLLGTNDKEHLSPGTEVGVRTRTTTLKTGEVLVLWLRATVVSRNHDGYEVVYDDGNWPPSDHYGTVHVPRRHVRVIKPSPSPTTPPPSGATSPCVSATTATVSAVKKKEMKPATRPTRAGKSLRLIRSLLPEMERQARADLPGGY